MAVDIVDRAGKYRCGRIDGRRTPGLRLFAFRDRGCECLFDAGPQDVSGVVDKLLFGMRGKRSGIDGDSENRHSAVGTRYGHLIGKSRSGNGDGGNARILGGLRFMTVAAFVPAVFRHCLLSLRRSDVIQ